MPNNFSFNEYLVIDTTGSIGIGSTNPQARFFVTGSSTVPSQAVAIVRAGTASPTDGTSVFEVQNSATTSLFFVSGSGFVGVGTRSNIPTTYTFGVRSGTDSQIGVRTLSGIGAGGTGAAFDSLTDNGSVQNFGMRAATYQFLVSPTTLSLYIASGGNVGIGTSTVNAKLHVEGSSILANNTAIDPDTYTNAVVAGAISDTGWAITAGIGGNAGTGDSWGIGHNGENLYFGIQNGSAANSMATYMQVSPSRSIGLFSNVGIGTTNPAYTLDVRGIMRSGVTGTGGRLYLARATDGVNLSQIFVSGSTGLTLESGGGGGFISFNVGTGGLDGGNAERMRIDGINGRVGIGITNPSYTLDVNGDINLASTRILRVAGATVINTNGSTGGDIYINSRVIRNESATSTDGMYIGYGNSGTTGGHLRFYANNITERMRIYADTGNVVISDLPGNVASSTARFLVSGSSTATTPTMIVREGVVSPTGGVLAFEVENSRGSTLFAVSGSGNVGVGTSNPSGRFEVIGTSGSLLLVTDVLSGSLFSVNDVTGLPIFEVFSDDTVVAGAVNSNALVVTGSRVGIGTNNPTARFHVGAGPDAPGAADTAMIVTNAGTTNLAVRDSSNNVELLNYVWSGGGLLGTYTSHSLYIRTANADRVTIDTSGNVGVAIAPNAAYKLHVNGSIAAWDGTNGRIVAIPSGGTAAGYVEWRTSAGTRLGYMGASSTDLPVVLENSANFSVTGGRVGIGTSTNLNSVLTVSSSISQSIDIQIGRAYAINNNNTGSINFVVPPGGGTRGTHDYGAIVVKGNSPSGVDNGGSAVFDLKVGGASTLSNDNSVFLRAEAIGGPGADMVSLYSRNTRGLVVSGSSAFVGIGTSIPSVTLHLRGDEFRQNSVTSFVSKHTFYDSTTELGYVGYNGGSDLNIWDKESFGNVNIGTANSTRVIVRFDGNVGIGTTLAFSERLLVKGSTADSSADALKVQNSNSTSLLYVRNDGLIQLKSDDVQLISYSANQNSKISFWNSGASYMGYVGFGGTTTLNIDNQASGPVSIKTNSTDRIWIDYSGNVGIGTTNPDRPLVVRGGNPTIGIYNTTAGGSNLTIDAPTSTVPGQIDVAGAFALRLNTNSAERMRIDSSGNVGIGTNNPSSRLEVWGSSTASTPTMIVREGVASPTAGAAAFQVQNSAGSALFIVSGSGAGTVGIGITAGAVAPFTAGGYGWLVTNGSSGAVFSQAQNGSELFRIQSDGGAHSMVGISSVPMVFKTVNVERMRISTTGTAAQTEVGIGTATLTSGRSLTTAADIEIYGVRVGRGGGANSSNTVVGSFAGVANNSSGENTAVGYYALNGNTTNANTAVGAYALTTVTGGDSNVAVGNVAMYDLTTGYNNVAVGSWAANGLTTPNSNTAVGAYSLTGVIVGSNNTAIGYSAIYGGASGNTAVGSNCLPGMSTSTRPSNNTAIGWQAGSNLTTGGDNVIIGAGTKVATNSNSNCIIIGSGSVGLGSNTTRIGNSSTTLTYLDGNVGIGTSASLSGKLHVWTSFYYGGNATGRPAAGTGTALVVETTTGLIRETSSSRKTKENIRSYATGLPTILSLKPVNFNFIGDSVPSAGFIAEDFAELGLEEFLLKDSDGNPTAIRYGEISALLVNGIKELKAENDSLKSDNERLKSDVEILKSQVASILATLNGS